jgi:hypothetical protein
VTAVHDAGDQYTGRHGFDKMIKERKVPNLTSVCVVQGIQRFIVALAARFERVALGMEQAAVTLRTCPNRSAKRRKSEAFLLEQDFLE